MNEAIGKILGMVMAYGVSSLGLFLAYVNYRKRTLGADRIMTGTAWAVLAVVGLAVAAGVLVVTQLAEIPVETEVAREVAAEPPAAEKAPAPAEDEGERDEWPLVGIVVPAVIFLFATWVTAALHRHFTSHGHSGHPEPGESAGG